MIAYIDVECSVGVIPLSLISVIDQDASIEKEAESDVEIDEMDLS